MTEAGRKPRWRRSMPGLGSYRGRYLYLAVLLVTAFSIVGAVGYRYVTRISEQNLDSIRDRAQATALLQDALSQLQHMQTQLGRYLINPPQETADGLLATGQRLALTIHQLLDAPWIRGEQEMKLLTQSANNDTLALTSLLEQLTQLRAERSQWLPVTASIENGINPANMAGQGILAEIVAETDEDPLNPENLELRRLVTRMQQLWLQAIAEVRLLITNRFGVFSNDTQGAMAGRAGNVQIYLSEFNQGLSRLLEMQAEGKLGFIADQKLAELQQVRDNYNDSVTKTVQGLTSDDWRPDLTLVRQRIEPQLNNLQQRISSMRLELDIQSARNITDLTQVSRYLTQFVAVLIGAGGLVAILAYLMFDRMLLRPIQQTVQALKQEARGEHASHPPQANADETRDLVDAFEEMRKQVRHRQEHLDHLAHHDPLTGLPNRLLFRDRLEHAVALASRNHTILAVLFLDLDRFKQINDSLGHATGDELLKSAAQRLQGVMRESDTVARLGGDEFAILAEGIKRREEVTRLAEKLIECLQEPFVLSGRTLHISTSIGITLCPNDDTSPEGLLQGADAAMYEAKRTGKGRFRYFTAAMTEQATEYLNLETYLRTAVLEQQFELHFQPVTDRTGTQLKGCEALLRWQHPEEGPLSPEVFIPVLDDMGQMGQVSQWILAELDRQQQRLRIAGYGHLDLAMNLTARLLHDGLFADHLLAALRAKHPDPEKLVIEITEDTLTQDLEAAERVLHQLKALGVRIALDDFGTGQSSLNHLRRYPFDVVKIDREFVRDIPHDPNDVDLVHAIIELSHAFGMSVVAEGVETTDQAQLLQTMGCDHLQGYLISRPMPSAALFDYLGAQHPTDKQA